MLNRRFLLLMLLAGLALPASSAAFAKDGESGGDGDGGGDGGGDSDSKSDDGDRNSGSGSRDDNDDDRDDSRTGGRDDDRRIRSAVESGRALPLRNILSSVRKRYDGKVVRIRLTGSGSRLTYRIRIIKPDNKLIEVRVNAANGRIIEPAGIY